MQHPRPASISWICSPQHHTDGWLLQKNPGKAELGLCIRAVHPSLSRADLTERAAPPPPPLPPLPPAADLAAPSWYCFASSSVKPQQSPSWFASW